MMASLRNEKLSVLFIVATLIAGVLIKQFLIHTAVKWGKHNRQRAVMDTSLSGIIEVCKTL